jgi:hypothetical protein
MDKGSGCPICGKPVAEEPGRDGGDDARFHADCLSTHQRIVRLVRPLLPAPHASADPTP